MRKGVLAALLFCMTCLPVIGLPQAFSQRGPAEAIGLPSVNLTFGRVNEKIKEIEGAKDLDEAVRTRLLGYYRDARNLLETAAAYDAAGSGFLEALKTAPAEEERISKTLRAREAKRQAAPEAGNLLQLPMGELEKRNAIAQAELTSLKEDLTALDDLIREQRGRPSQIKDELASARKGLQDIEAGLKASRLSGDNMLILDARQTSLQAARTARLREIAMLKKELASYGARTQLLSAQRELLAQNLARAQLRAKPIEEALQRKIKDEAERARASSDQSLTELEAKNPLIRQTTRESMRLAGRITAIGEATRETTVLRDGLQAQLKSMEQEFSDARQRVHVAGFSKSLGHILLERLRKLDDWRRFDRESRKLTRRIGDVWLEHINVEEALRPLSNIDAEVERLKADGMGDKGLPATGADVEGELRDLLKDQKSLLSKLSDAYVGYIGALGDLEVTQRQLGDTAREYRKFLESRVLWIPSTQSLGRGEPRELFLAVRALVSPSRLMEVPKTLGADIVSNYWLYALFLASAFILIRYRRPLRTYVEATSDQVWGPNDEGFRLTAKAFVATALMASLIPLCLGFCAWRFQDSTGATEFTRSVGKALSTIAMPYYFLSMLRLLCIEKGVGQAHFRWDDAVVGLLRRELRWFVPIFLPIAFVVSVTWFGADVERGREGRLFFVGAMAAVAVIAGRVLQPTRGVPAGYLTDHPNGWADRLRYAWYLAVIAIPLLLAALSLTGYSYTAIQIADDVFKSLWLIIGTIVAHDLVLRALGLMRRPLPEMEGAKEVLAAESRQTKKLLHAFIGIALIIGLLAIWAEVFPALTALDQVSLWQRTITIGGKEIQQPVTLSILAVIAVLAALTIVLARNLPGALETLLFKHLPITPGSRYAISQLLRYTIVFTGIVIIFHTFGGSWSQIQWLVAALGVGLGFGLQEIFGNLISGVILLFERPIRVGDTVTIGNVTGRVSQIRMRATTITDWDNKELVIPNKSFITGQLVNWTLSNPITRISFGVGIAYGSDATAARQIMLDMVRSNPLVMETPEPAVYFTGFGESSMDFTVYAYAKELSDRLAITHGLHVAIEAALRQHGIAIPFPQRDVYIKAEPFQGGETISHPDRPESGQ